MSKYSLEHRFFMVEQFIRTESLTETVKLFKKRFGSHHNINPSTIKRTYDRLKTTGSLLDDTNAMKSKENTVRTDENIQKVKEFMDQNPSTSIRKASSQLEIDKTSLHRILKNDLSLKPYKIQLHQPISEASSIKRLEFVNNLLSMLENSLIDKKRIWFTDEAHFQLHGYVNKQNWRIWGEENPHYSLVNPLHPQRITVWCAICADMVIGPVFIDQNVTGAVYLEFLKEQFIPFASAFGKIDDYWFMQDGARPHRVADVFNLIEEHFGKRLICLDSAKFTGNGIDWPPYSPDLNPCDYFLWGYLKDKVFKQQFSQINELKDGIEEEIKGIGNYTLEKVIENFEFRLRNVIASQGNHFENLFN